MTGRGPSPPVDLLFAEAESRWADPCIMGWSRPRFRGRAGHETVLVAPSSETVLSGREAMATVFENEVMDGDAADGDLDRLREENRRLAITLGAFSAFIASKGLLEEAWHFIHNVHQMDGGPTDWGGRPE